MRQLGHCGFAAPAQLVVILPHAHEELPAFQARADLGVVVGAGLFHRLAGGQHLRRWRKAAAAASPASASAGAAKAAACAGRRAAALGGSAAKAAARAILASTLACVLAAAWLATGHIGECGLARGARLVACLAKAHEGVAAFLTWT